MTRATDSRRERDFAAIDKDQFIKAEVSTGDWHVMPVAGARINRIRQRLDRYLADLEREGIDEFFAPTDAAASPAVERIWRQLGVVSGYRLKWKKPGQIGLGHPAGHVVILNPDDLNSVVQREAMKHDNRNKLRDERASVRGLAVVVDSLEHSAWSALAHERLPADGPDLPEEITDAWAIAATRDHAWAAHARRQQCWGEVRLVSIPPTVWETAPGERA